jgi:hypothetical protein
MEALVPYSDSDEEMDDAETLGPSLTNRFDAIAANPDGMLRSQRPRGSPLTFLDKPRSRLAPAPTAVTAPAIPTPHVRVPSIKITEYFQPTALPRPPPEVEPLILPIQAPESSKKNARKAAEMVEPLAHEDQSGESDDENLVIMKKLRSAQTVSVQARIEEFPFQSFYEKDGELWCQACKCSLVNNAHRIKKYAPQI